MTATDGTVTISGSKTYVLKQAPAGKKLYLKSPKTTTETVTYQDADAAEKSVDSAGKKVAAPPVRNPGEGVIINHVTGVSRGQPADVTDAGKAGVTVVLAPIQIMIDVP